MMIFAPLKLLKIVPKIEEQHPLPGEAASVLPAETLKAIVLRIDQRTPDELKPLAATLSSRQVRSLCVYLPQNTYQVDLKKVSQVISHRMSAACFQILFQEWQKAPDCMECLSLLGRHDDARYRPQGFLLKSGLLAQWSTASRPLMAVVRTAEDLGRGTSFSEKLMSIGIKENTNLARRCIQTYLMHASKETFRREGDQHLTALLEGASRAVREGILLRLLQCAEGDTAFLTFFPGLYQVAYALWGEPDPDPFQNETLFAAYTWWYNYYQLSNAMGRDRDKRRTRYWQQYLDRCKCARIEKHRMLVMYFHDYVVTEFEVMGPVYIFNTKYFDHTVRRYMSTYSTSNLKSWLYNESEYLSRETHIQHWEINQTRALRKVGII